MSYKFIVLVLDFFVGKPLSCFIEKVLIVTFKVLKLDSARHLKTGAFASGVLEFVFAFFIKIANLGLGRHRAGVDVFTDRNREYFAINFSVYLGVMLHRFQGARNARDAGERQRHHLLVQEFCLQVASNGGHRNLVVVHLPVEQLQISVAQPVAVDHTVSTKKVLINHVVTDRQPLRFRFFCHQGPTDDIFVDQLLLAATNWTDGAHEINELVATFFDP